ncbi:phospholipase D/nuclease [Choiromyces venosus 120613-1]|uniref:Phospholipase D/nuclease n=1 Tax=Choiromyces venosus 120613-1 TaxID=1336337 RepID=A0A3N4J1F9_9PEZI|nr:phospholipase D/nuclease [Choiromyces venosus 120613-1]
MSKKPSPRELGSLHAPVSPPKLKRKERSPTPPLEKRLKGGKAPMEQQDERSRHLMPIKPGVGVASPFQLTRIGELPESENVDAVGIRDILRRGPLKEVWIFNYLFDLDWVMNQFDPEVKDTVQVRIVHGSWRREDTNRIRIHNQAENYPNVKIICAYMPEPFGTHHSKMFVLFRADDHAQVIIHTANMIPFDWQNMTQAAWQSPLLPLLPRDHGSPSAQTFKPIGQNFKTDLLAYFSAYGEGKTDLLTAQLLQYSFDPVKAVFVGSVPGKFHIDASRRKGYEFGWRRLANALRKVPLRSPDIRGRIVVQVSSIATLGSKNTWLSPVLFSSLKNSKVIGSTDPNFHIIFPTPNEIRDSLNGYRSGSSIHLKYQSPAQLAQLGYMRRHLTHWDSNIPPNNQSSSSPAVKDAGRTRAAPHIKTYIRFSDAHCTHIDWALLTSANISTQAWGSGEKDPAGTIDRREVRICSYEAGVLVYPEILGVEEMVPTFKKDMPDEIGEGGTAGLRMPYGLPLRKYASNEMPWCASKNYTEVDWLGQTWEA